MAKTRVEHAERTCEQPGCGTVFTPQRMTQRFCSTACRKAYHLTGYRVAPHPCPLCTLVHDPEEAPVLDALELWIRDNSMPGTGGPYDQLWASDLRAFIARRRAILRGEPAGAAL